MAQAIEKWTFGGVDSKSNPLQMPQDRALRCSNWTPNPGGWLELRRGYTSAVGDYSTDAEIHSFANFQTLDLNGQPVRWLMIGSGREVWQLNLGVGYLQLLGELPSSDKWGTFTANGQLFIGTKKGVWFWDGKKLRKSGIRQLSATEAGAVTVGVGTYSPTSDEIAAVTLTPGASGGNLNGPTTQTGIQVYMVYFDTIMQTFGCSAAIGSRLQLTGTGAVNKISLTGLPNLASVSSALVKVFALTKDGGQPAGIACESALTCSITSSGTTATIVIAAGSSWIEGNLLLVDFTSVDRTLNGLYVIRSITGGTNATINLKKTPTTPINGTFSVCRVPGITPSAATGEISWNQ